MMQNDKLSPSGAAKIGQSHAGDEEQTGDIAQRHVAPTWRRAWLF
jgi:hypothetical protein